LGGSDIMRELWMTRRNIGITTETGGDGRAEPTYRIGHCRPPIEHRFKPGQSGNPGGKPRRAATGAPGDRLPGAHEPTKSMILAEAQRMVTVRIGDEAVEMPMNEAVFRALGEAALGGSRIAQRHWTRMVREAEAEQRRDQIAVHNAVEWPVGDRLDRTKRPITADYGDEIIVDRRTKVTVIKEVEG
jgi:hypothetical protein